MEDEDFEIDLDLDLESEDDSDLELTQESESKNDDDENEELQQSQAHTKRGGNDEVISDTLFTLLDEAETKVIDAFERVKSAMKIVTETITSSKVKKHESDRDSTKTDEYTFQEHCVQAVHDIEVMRIL